MLASLCLALFHAAGPAAPAVPLGPDDILPPAPRRAERRTFGDESRGPDDRRAGAGAAFSPDGRWLLVGAANRGV
ncbi:MAG: hypothetical protein ACRC33_07590, partial [Gemmataceae bacterium]